MTISVAAVALAIAGGALVGAGANRDNSFVLVAGNACTYVAGGLAGWNVGLSEVVEKCLS